MFSTEGLSGKLIAAFANEFQFAVLMGNAVAHPPLVSTMPPAKMPLTPTK